MSYIVDTNIFNKLIDGTINGGDLPSDGLFIATHIQIDEISKTKDNDRRARLFLMSAEVRPQFVPTESFVLGVSRLDHGKPSDGVLYEKLKHELDLLNRSKTNNAKDVLIAEVAIVNDYTLLTADRHLAEAVKKLGGKVVYFKH